MFRALHFPRLGVDFLFPRVEYRKTLCDFGLSCVHGSLSRLQSLQNACEVWRRVAVLRR
jgi:hypothetical protein